jgi:NAD(P)-dependent dehydrogenase (short-subunit alcohol dehydrogenase family)
MSNRVVLITGALAGIGRATASAFARQGDSIVISGRNDAEGRLFASELRELGGPVEYLRADVGIEDEVEGLVNGVIDAFGQLDVAVNNAGFTGNPGPLTSQTLETYDAVFGPNVLGLFFCLKHELRVMTERGAGNIVNLSSTFGERGGAGAALYVASKHAVNGFTRAAALEVASLGIRVNAVAPGPTATGGLDRFVGNSDERLAAMAAGVPMGHLGTVDDIADVITFLASDAARFMTGQIVAVNGGKTAA